MTYARLRDILNMLDKDKLSQQVTVLTDGKAVSVDYADTFRDNKDLAQDYGVGPEQLFLTNYKEL